jgi:hypothetical protein
MTMLSVLVLAVGYCAMRIGPLWLAAAVGGAFMLAYLLHDLGILAWRDDFQREVAMRAGVHALIAVGLVSAFLLATYGAGENLSRDPDLADRAIPTAALILRVAIIAWGMSWLLQYWGGRTGAVRILWILLGVSFLDTIASTVRARPTDPMGLATLVRFSWYPLGILALLGCRRWPRIGGAVLGLFVVGASWFLARGMSGVGLLEDSFMQLYVVEKAVLLWVPAMSLVSARRPLEE